MGQLLCAEYPKLAAAVHAQLDVDRLDPTDYVFVPVHAWQLAQVVRPLLADEIADRTQVRRRGGSPPAELHSHIRRWRAYPVGVARLLFTDLAADPALRGDVATDRAVLLGPTLPTKAFARMRLNPAGGDHVRPRSATGGA